MTRARAGGYALVCLAVYAGAVSWFLSGHGVLDPLGRPLGTDFISFWSVSAMSREGAAVLAYSPAHLAALERAVAGADVGFFAWFYPPIALFVVRPLASVPYLPALLVWSAAGLLAYVVVVAVIARDRVAALLAVASPAAFVCLEHGQNALLLAAVLAGALLVLDRAPVVAGALFAIATFKPQFGVLCVVALLAGRRWRVLASASAFTLALIGASAIVFGGDVWRGFRGQSTLVLRVLEEGLVSEFKMQSVFAAARLLGAPVLAAWLLQAVASASATLAVVWLWRSNAAPALQKAGLLAAATLATPFVLDYDLALLGPALAWLACAAAGGAALGWERIVAAVVWALPLVSRSVAQYGRVPIAPVVTGLLLACIVRRARSTGSGSAETLPARQLRLTARGG